MMPAFVDNSKGLFFAAWIATCLVGCVNTPQVPKNQVVGGRIVGVEPASPGPRVGDTKIFINSGLMPNSERASDGITVNFVENEMRVVSSKVIGYILLYDADRHRFSLLSRDSARWDSSGGRGVVWLDAGLWGYEIISVDGVVLAALEERKAYDAIFNPEESLQLILKSPTGVIVKAEAFTRR